MGGAVYVYLFPFYAGAVGSPFLFVVLFIVWVCHFLSVLGVTGGTKGCRYSTWILRKDP